MKRLAIAAIAAATVSAAIPASAGVVGKPAGTTGRGGRTTLVCYTSTVGKKATNCGPGTAGTQSPFWP